MSFGGIFVILMLFAQAQEVSAPSSLTCDQSMIDFGNQNPSKDMLELCQKDPKAVIALLKFQITQYLCLYHSDLECLKKTSAFTATMTNTNKNLSAEFERIVGNSYLTTWLNDDPNRSYNHPALKLLQINSKDGVGGNSELTVENLSSVLSTVSAVLPYGGAISLAATGIGTLATMGQAQSSPDPNNTCSEARRLYINATPDGRSCVPNFNFNSEPVARLLRQPEARQAEGLRCPDTCKYLVGLSNTVGISNSVILQIGMPLFEQKPQCLDGNRVRFSFEALDSSHNKGIQIAPTFRNPLSWKGLVFQSALRSPGGVYYRFQNEVRPPGTYLRWEVTGDMVMRRQIAAKVSPDYSLGFSDVKLSIPSKTQGDLGFSSPQVSIGPSQIKTHGPLHQIADPAIQAMGIATAYVSGCCSVSNPNRDQCLSRFQTIDDYRIRNTPEVPKTPSDTSR